MGDISSKLRFDSFKGGQFVGNYVIRIARNPFRRYRGDNNGSRVSIFREGRRGEVAGKI